MQVFRNVFENSLAATRDPVEIHVDCRSVVQGYRPAWQVRVSDNGPGLTAEQRTRVFEPFYTTKAKGTGLGMPIARRIIEAHQGTIEATPSAGGAEFVLTIPHSGPA